ncbi:MAG: DUF1330 domain-containing protein [Phycisphaerales bacterium]|nr:DUF1330 domain-containing protein [Phycisphaerales bacterium]
MNEKNRHEILVGLHVSDEAAYARYREAMTPLLEARGGFFRLDFRVAEVLRGPDSRVNRVFIISFPDQATMDGFFDDPEYKQIRAAHFDPAVESGGVIATFSS